MSEEQPRLVTLLKSWLKSRLVSSAELVNASVRQAAAIHFKNVVKGAWDAEAAEENDAQSIKISENDRVLIKRHLVELMCTVPPQIQAQCSESISLFAAVDFPAKWDNLLVELVQKFNSADPAVVVGVLLTANSILKRFRYVQRSDDLYRDLAYVLQRLQEPLLTLFKTTGRAVEAYASDANQLRPRFASLHSICRIFFSLNWQDLPEYFEDHIAEWMEEFARYLGYKSPILTDDDEENEPSPIDKLQAAVVDWTWFVFFIVEEPFMPYEYSFLVIFGYQGNA